MFIIINNCSCLYCTVANIEPDENDKFASFCKFSYLTLYSTCIDHVTKDGW